MSIGEGLVRVGAPVLVGVLFAAALLQTGAAPERDLQIVAASAVPSGRPMALRALWLEGLRRPEGPSLVPGPVMVDLRDAGGRSVARGRLEPSAVAGMEGVLEVPSDAAGALSLRARASTGGRESRVHAPVEVLADAPVPERRGRFASPLQQYQPFAVRAEGNAPVPRPFDVRVQGGACVPEVPCTLRIWVGTPAAAVELTETGAVEPLQGRAAPTDGVATLSLVVHGPEAEAEVVAHRKEQPVARRTVRLPVAQGAPVLELKAMEAEAPASPPLRVRGVAPGRAIIVDAFRQGYWERTGSTSVGNDGWATLPFAPLDEGVWRIQVRTDAYGVGSSAVRVLVVRPPGADPAWSLRALAERSDALSLEDPFAARVRASGPPEASSVTDALAFMAALQELGVVELPRALSGYVQQTVGARATLDARRVGAAAGVALVGLLVGGYLLWRGWRASSEAGRLLSEAAGEGGAPPGRRPIGAVVGVALAVALIFVLVALFIATRGTFG